MILENDASFKSAAREQDSLLTPLEKKALLWLAHRMPVWVSPDHLTVLGLLGTTPGGSLLLRRSLVSSRGAGFHLVSFHQLVRRQPGWDSRARTPTAAAPIRLLRGSYCRYDWRPVSDRRPRI